MATWHVLTRQDSRNNIVIEFKIYSLLMWKDIFQIRKSFVDFECSSVEKFFFSNKSLMTTNEHQTNVIVFTTANEFWQKRAFPMCLNSGASLTCKASCNVVIITLLLCLIHRGLENEKISAIKINHFRPPLQN